MVKFARRHVCLPDGNKETVYTYFLHHHSQNHLFSLKCFPSISETANCLREYQWEGRNVEKAVKLSFTKPKFGLSKAEGSWCFQLWQELQLGLYKN